MTNLFLHKHSFYKYIFEFIYFSHCDARNNGAQCSGTLGETMFLRLIHNASGIRIDLLKGNVILLQWRINITATNKIKDRSDFIPDNGTFRINDLKHNDSGEYKLTVFDSRGEITENRTLCLSVQGKYLTRK
uniref:Immunoglobulin subtype domain-containing protein n=1 Tax=Poecilia latipinna TaxID=48699 RepID=A0A3B3UNF1_9TELE